MIEERIADPASFLRSLGDLHDVAIARIAYDAERNAVELSTPDLNWNEERLPGYVARPCTIALMNVTAFSIEAGQDRFHTTLLNEGAHVAEAHAISKSGVHRMDIVMSTGERWYVEFGEMTVCDEAVT